MILMRVLAMLRRWRIVLSTPMRTLRMNAAMMRRLALMMARMIRMIRTLMLMMARTPRDGCNDTSHAVTDGGTPYIDDVCDADGCDG